MGMNELDQARRCFLLGLGSLSVSQALPASHMGSEAAEHLLHINEGEHLIHFRDHGNITIKFSGANGSNHFALGTQQVMAGGGIPIHRHVEMEEAFYVVEGGGILVLHDERHAFEKGATIFIPRSSWHGFENPDRELLLLWIVSPPGLDGFFRETCSPPGQPPKQLTRERIREIARKYGTEFR
jgi:quercetin dioxygenase-like cupin family protein